MLLGLLPNLYGLLVGLAVLSGFLVSRAFASRLGIRKRDVDDLLPWLVLSGFAGARFYFVIFSWENFRGQPWEAVQIWHGGLAIYGGIIGAAAATLLYSRIKKISFWRIADLVALAAPLGQAIGRWGNFFNQEAFGRPTASPWGIYISPERRPPEYLRQTHFHPAFFYEFLWDFAVFFLLLYLLRKTRLPPGAIFGSYLLLYAAGRFFIESLRIDSFWAAGFRVDQITSIIAFAAGFIILLSYVRRRLENH